MRTKFILFALLLITAFQSKAQFPCDPTFTFTTSPTGLTTFTGVSSGSMSQSFTWTFGNGTAGTGLTASTLYNTPGTYVVCLVVQDTSFLTPCIDSNCVTITIAGSTTCSAAFTAWVDTSLGAPPNSYEFHNQSIGTGLSYIWDFGDGSPNSNAQNPLHTYTSPGSYNVCLIIYNSTGCTDSTCQLVTTSASSCFADFYFIPDTMVGTPANTYNFTSTSYGFGLTYEWNFGDGSPLSSAANPAHTFPTSGTYLVCLKVTSSVTGCIDSTCLTVSGSPVGPCNASFFLYQDSLAGPGVYIGINTSTGTGLTYTWTWGDGSSSTGPYPSHTYASPGLYTICLIVTSALCVDSFCSTQWLNKTSGMVSINIQAPTGLASVEKTEASIYPNPVENQLYIKGENNQVYDVEIYTLNGNKVYTTSTKANVAIDVHTLSANFYLLKVIDKEGKSNYAKFIKQ